MKSVFVVMSAEFFHPGHLNIIKVARELGEVTVGLAIDEFNATYKRLPFMSYEERKSIVENIKGVTRVIPQDTLDLAPILKELKPDYFVHGDDWKTGRLSAVRQQVIEVLKGWGGILVEPPYTKGISSTKLNDTWRAVGVTSESRTHRFRRLIEYQPIVRLLEVHDGLSGLIVEHTQVQEDGKTKEFDGMWFSSSTNSLSKGRPINTFVDLTSQIVTIQDVLDGTTKPLIVDVGTGGTKEQFLSMVRTFERIGVSAVAIRDRAGIDRPEFVVEEIKSAQNNNEHFAKKISSGKKAQLTEDFSIIAGINSHLLYKDSENILRRAQTYIEAGADAVMVQSQANNLAELFKFSRLYTVAGYKVPLFAAIPALSSLSDSQLVEAGLKVVVFPDQLLRTAYTSMMKTAKMLLSHSKVFNIDELGVPISEISDFVPGLPV